ncbi:hypothetical protein U5922_004900 [Aquicoccus sp. G2-2]|uniref:hypothetical protein n=1 Tax=Aquicoccus sp. G2-2 TaxID=3092120 RepID=UPI002ADF6722|nr:hypothetical protein [Aquicoccus sp. G2-2]MEA1112842.1 hypothetical protein [Aquicoccus sp. G2-2]
MRSLVLILAALPAPAFADYNMNGKIIDCYCTDTSGAHVDIGEKICLQVDGKMFIAQCQMSLNVPMWRKISDGCLSSQLIEPRLDPRPVHAEIAAPKS